MSLNESGGNFEADNEEENEWCKQSTDRERGKYSLKAKNLIKPTKKEYIFILQPIYTNSMKISLNISK